jgi:hypothetical protein
MPSQGPLLAGTGANVTGIGTIAWTNPSNITTSGASFATAALTSSASSEWLVGTNFGFTIPAGSTITGITVSCVAKYSGSVSKIQAVVLWYGGTSQSTEAPAQSITTTAVLYTFTGPWSVLPPVATVNGSGFGFAVSCVQGHLTTSTTSVNDYLITITYTAAAGGVFTSRMPVFFMGSKS